MSLAFFFNVLTMLGLHLNGFRLDDDNDDVSSTVSNLSDLSGLSDISGQDWKPISGKLL